MVISNVGSLGGGGALDFRDMVMAIREKRPDVDVVAVCPWKGSLVAECAFGRVTVEAMRAGLPVCGTNTDGTAEIIDAGVNGLLSPAGDANALAANLMALESDEDLRRKLAVGAVESAQRFHRDRHDDELAAILGLC